MADSESGDIYWSDLKSASDNRNQENQGNRQSYEEVSRKTLEALDKKGWCLWRCRLFNDEIICVVRDEKVFDPIATFFDPLRDVKRSPYPFFTVDELSYLLNESDETVRMIYAAKKLAPAKVLFEEIGNS